MGAAAFRNTSRTNREAETREAETRNRTAGGSGNRLSRQPVAAMSRFAPQQQAAAIDWLKPV